MAARSASRAVLGLASLRFHLQEGLESIESMLESRSHDLMGRPYWKNAQKKLRRHLETVREVERTLMEVRSQKSEVGSKQP